jgi:hypothetical protein
MLYSTSAQAILEIVIVKTDRSNESVPSSVKLLACSYDGCVTVGRGNHETPTVALQRAIERYSCISWSAAASFDACRKIISLHLLFLRLQRQEKLRVGNHVTQ